MRIDLNPEPPAPHAVAEEAAVDDFLLQGATASNALNASAGRQWTTWWVVLAVSVHAVVIGGVLYLKPTMFKMDAARTSDSADKALPVEWIGQAPPIVAVPSPPLQPRVAPQTPARASSNASSSSSFSSRTRTRNLHCTRTAASRTT